MDHFKKYVEEELKNIIVNAEKGDKRATGITVKDIPKIAAYIAGDEYVSEKLGDLIDESLMDFKKKNNIK